MTDRRRQPPASANTSPVQESYSPSEPTALLDLVIAKSGRSRSAAKRLLASGRVAVAGRPTTAATLVVPAGALVTVHRLAPAAPFAHPLITIEWEDDAYVAVYKRAGIATVNTAHRDPHDTVMYLLSRHYKQSNPLAKLFMLTRLDKSSAGFVLFAKSPEAKERLVRSWSRAVRHQRYAVVAEGVLPSGDSFRLTSHSAPVDEERKKEYHIRGKAVSTPSVSVTAEVRPLASSPGGLLHLVEADVLDARIYSMRKIFGDNRLRIFGDIRYHSRFYSRDRIALQQTELEIVLPHTGEALRLTRPVPDAFRQLLRRDKPQHETTPHP